MSDDWKATPFVEAAHRVAREVAREEIVSLAGLVWRRLQEWESTSEVAMLSEIFGEILRDFSSKGEEPGE